MPNARETIAVGAIVGLEEVSRYQGVPSARARASRDRAGAISRDLFHKGDWWRASPRRRPGVLRSPFHARQAIWASDHAKARQLSGAGGSSGIVGGTEFGPSYRGRAGAWTLVRPPGARTDDEDRRPRAVPRRRRVAAVGSLAALARPCRASDAFGSGDSRRSRISGYGAGGARRGR